jgi:hypothetical protein
MSLKYWRRDVENIAKCIYAVESPPRVAMPNIKAMTFQQVLARSQICVEEIRPWQDRVVEVVFGFCGVCSSIISN